MGRISAESYAFLAKENPDKQASCILAHMQSNCFPPIHRDFLPAFQLAIKECNEGRSLATIVLPNGKKLPAWKVVRNAHLEAFLDVYDDEDDEGEDRWS